MLSESAEISLSSKYYLQHAFPKHACDNTKYFDNFVCIAFEHDNIRYPGQISRYIITQI